MKNKKSVRILLILGIYFIFYFIATVLQSKFWVDILAPIGGVMAFGITLNTYLKSDRTQNIGKIWIVISLACLSWAIADTLWFVCYWVFGQNANNNDLISLFYFGTNGFLFATIFIYAVYKFKKWNTIQLILDYSVISVSTLLLMWIFFFDKCFKLLDIINGNGWKIVLIIFVDVVIFIGIATGYISTKNDKISMPIRIVTSGILIYTFIDLYWVYLDINNMYIPNSIVDAVYIASLLVIAMGATLQRNCNKTLEIKDYNYYIISVHYKAMYVLVGPALVIIFKGIDIIGLIDFFFINLVYLSATGYVQTSIKNEELLKKECKLNLELENRIEERTKELVEKNKQLIYLSNHDALTNLYNRRYLMNALEKELTKIAPNETLALLFVDLDRFKIINDTYGHAVGDQILIEVSRRLEALNNKNGFLARLGGDEFVFAFHTSHDYDEIEKIAQQIIDGCSKIIEIEGHSFYLTITVGISIYPLDAQNANELLKNADMAMYQGKKRGYNRFVSFNQKINDTIQRKNKIEILLKKVEFDKEFILFFQPQFSIPDKKLIGMEALLRWNNPQKGFIPPGEFIPIAEETDDIVRIGDWVMKKAISQIVTWNKKYGLDLKMAINVSPKQLFQTNFIKELQLFMKKCSASPDWVDVEITEGIAMEEKYPMSDVASKLKDVGASISIDDFGTGYSSLSCLKLFPFDRIKIAKELVDAITTDYYDLHIIKFAVLLAKSIGIRTIAEGVESEEQFDLLTNLGCEQIQGYFLGKPVPSSEFEELFLQN